jgi:hypothetical protein
VFHFQPADSLARCAAVQESAHPAIKLGASALAHIRDVAATCFPPTPDIDRISDVLSATRAPCFSAAITIIRLEENVSKWPTTGIFQQPATLTCSFDRLAIKRALEAWKQLALMAG